MTTKLFLNALGIISPLGTGKEENLQNLLSGSLSGMIWHHDFIDGKKVKLGTVSSPLPEIDEKLVKYNTRCNRLLLAAYEQIEQQVKETIKKYGKDRVAIIIGSGTGGIDAVQKDVDSLIKTKTYSASFYRSVLEIAIPSEFLAEYIGLSGISYTVSTACTSSSKAFASASNLLDMGVCDAVIVGGSDDLCKLTVNGFYALESVSDDICNPFSKNRDGISLGEGAALFLLTREKSDIALLGTGESSDGYHATSPDPEGNGAVIAIRAALDEAGLKASDIDYVNLHGTGTVLNDQMESAAMNKTGLSQTPSSSTKPMVGHILGSAGIIELAFCWLLLSKYNKNKKLPPHIWDGAQDKNIAPLTLVNKDQTAKRLEVCMSNSFAFGGSNVSLIIGKSDV